MLDLVPFGPVTKPPRQGVTLGAARQIKTVGARPSPRVEADRGRGRFFIAGDGTATFYSRLPRTSLTAQTDFTDSDSSFIDLPSRLLRRQPDPTVHRDPWAGVPQRAQSASSIAPTGGCRTCPGCCTPRQRGLGRGQWRVFKLRLSDAAADRCPVHLPYR